ncbi:MAG: hypothetical protein IKQ31_00885 [Clostridia bacterium]|nr:hypothetical protein [Clostridia bacterium]
MRKTSAFNKLTAIMCAAIGIAFLAVFGTLFYEKQMKYSNVSASQAEEETVTLTNAPSVTSSLLYGDVNLDGAVNNNDCIELSNYLSYKIGSLDGRLTADVNKDGSVTYADLLILRFYLDKKIEYLPYTYKVKIGDVNCDDIIDYQDAYFLKENLNKTQGLTTHQALNADTNVDGIINEADVKLLNAYLATLIGSLPFTETIVFGDVNLDKNVNVLDSVMIQKYIAKSITLSDHALLNADVNEDNVVNDVDATLIRFYLSKTISTLPYSTNTILGDINVDGKVNNADVELLGKFLRQSNDLTCDGSINADVNADNKIDYADQLILKAFVEKKINNLPYKDSFRYGDVNNDGLNNLDDYSFLKNALTNKTSLDLRTQLSADVNKDGEINHTDELILLAFAKKEILTLPYDYQIVAGDVNIDGKINMQDVQKLSLNLSNETSLTVLETANADTTGNGTVDKTDLGVLVAYVNNKIKSLPYDPDKQPLYVKIAQGIVQTGEGAYNAIVDFFTFGWLNDVGNAIGGAFNAAGNGIVSTGEDAYDTLAGATTATGDAITGAGETTYNALAGAGSAVVHAFEDAYNGICNFFGNLFK